MLKRKTALILAALIFMSLLPVIGLAQGLSPGPDTLGTDTDLATDTDSVVYNLLNQEVTVGHDAARAADAPLTYKLFDENGNYTIELEDNAFFPYEVQFQYDGKTEIKWFDTPDSSVQIGSHMFTVRSEMNDPSLLTQIGVYIDGEYVAARPEPKEFKAKPGISAMSLLPLATTNVNLDLKGKFPSELRSVKLSAVISGLTPAQTIDGSAQVVWVKGYQNDNYKVINDQASAMLDLSPSGAYSTGVTLDMIVGTANQFDASNKRYIVNISITPTDDMLSFAVSTEEQGTRTKKILYSTGFSQIAETSSRPEYRRYSIGVNAPFEWEQEAYMGLHWDSGFNSTGLAAKVYGGWYNTAAEAENAAASNSALELTGTVWNVNMTAMGAGHKDDYTDYEKLPRFTLVFMRNGQAVETMRIEVYIYKYTDGVSISSLYKDDGGSRYSVVHGGHRMTYTNDGVTQVTSELYAEYPASEEYYLTLTYYYQGNYNNQQTRANILKAVVGHFDTLSAAVAQADIKNQLFPDNTYTAGSGYKARFGGDGLKFTVFGDDGGVHKYTYMAVDGLTPRMNVSLSSDTYFEVTGAKELTDVYIMPFRHDSYYREGFQTIFTTENADMSAVSPTFIYGNGANIYAENPPVLQTSDANSHNFSSGPVQYSASAEDGKNLKNYWVTFVEKHIGGAKLFVNGINGPDGAKREVFLNSAYDNLHDVFIANVGDAPLTEITATLNATNVKLDEYWTAGGDSSKNTLAAFTAVTPAGQLANVAKIRLLPDGEGEITGTLTIAADGQEPVVIELTGFAGDPKIITSTLRDAVKYVPYATMIQHTNKFDWNTVSFAITSGALPAGMELKPNGEIYGAPLETGTFTFTIRMTNSYSGFSDSTATYTLIVKENTDPNVDGETDAGYDVTVRVPDTVIVYDDYVFKSDGAFGEFIDFWLDGQRKTKDVDYKVDPGSTKITVYAQTFQNAGSGTHTIAAEFRVDGNENKELKRAAQNYTLNIQSDYNDNGNGGGGDSSSSGGDSAGAPSAPPSAAPSFSSSGANGSVTSALFSKNPNSPDCKDIAFYLDLNGALLSNITSGSNVLQYGTDFTSSGMTFTINKEFIASLSAGVHVLQFNLDNGTVVELSIAVVEAGNGVAYTLLSGFDNYTGNGEISARIDAAYEGFAQLLYNGSPMYPGSYNSRSGSTIITLNKEYLDTLPDGVHIFRAEFIGGYADLLLEVRRQSVLRVASSVPQTGDTGYDLMAWIAVLAASLIGFTGVALWRRRMRTGGRW